MPARVKSIVFPAVIIVVGVAIAVALTSARKSPPREEQSYAGPLVSAITVRMADHPVVVTGNGTVRARVFAQVIPQVSGRVVALHRGMASGGFFKAGETLIEVESADYELAVHRAEAAVAQATVRLQLEEGEAEVARREWERMHPGEEPSSPLVLREPQMMQAQAEVAAAEADLATAELNLDRTRISMPWDGRVVSESLDIGQLVVAGQPVATAYGTDAVEIAVPLQDSQLAWFHVPGPGERSTVGAEAVVIADFAGGHHQWRSRIVRSESEIDPSSRMVHVVAEVRDPFTADAGRTPLVPGMFVEVKISGSLLPDVVEVPRSAVRSDGSVWVVEDNRLQVRQVEVSRREPNRAFVSAGLDHGDVVIVSQLDVVTDGMKVRVAGMPMSGAEAGVPASEEVGS